MKKGLAIVLALVLALVTAVPAMAIDTSVTVLQGTGGPPVIKCKWETPDSADPGHSTPGTQVEASGVYDQSVQVCVFAVITDPQGVITMMPPAPEGNVYATITYPLGPPMDGAIKYEQITMTPVDPYTESFPHNVAGLIEFDAAVGNGLITADSIAAGHTLESIREQLVQGEAYIWKGCFDLHYHQPAGDYGVCVEAFDPTNLVTEMCNTVTYAAKTMVEVDFTSVNYGEVDVCSNRWIGGDNEFGVPNSQTGAMMNTIRNIGNTNAYVTVMQDDMGFGKSDVGTPDEHWNVNYDARIGTGDYYAGEDIPGVDITYMPEETATIPDVLMLCNTHKIDFSIHVLKGLSGSYTGTMTIGATEAPF
jgi:hypothetical protein